jgi:hypothetical protein
MGCWRTPVRKKMLRATLVQHGPGKIGNQRDGQERTGHAPFPWRYARPHFLRMDIAATAVRPLSGS